MSRDVERRLLQATICVLALSPLVFGAIGILQGLAGFGQTAPGRDADSHFRYLSGIFWALGPLALTCVPRVDTRAERLLTIVALVVAGGLARLYGMVAAGAPSPAHLGGLATELIVTPLLGAWAWSFARRRRARSASDSG